MLEDSPLTKIVTVLEDEIGMVTMAESTDKSIRNIRDKIRNNLRGVESEQSRKA